MSKTRKLVRLIHNPNAGEGTQPTKEEIIDLICSEGYQCDCSSSKKKPLKAIEPHTEFIAIAGGDGTIRKTIMQLLNKKLKYKRPIALLPFGTANNIASSLGISENTKQSIKSWSTHQLKKFDVGQVSATKNQFYFLESFGFGLFPRLMSNLKSRNTEHVSTPEDEFKMALEELLEITRNYPAVTVKLEINDEILELSCILIEVMNISSLGPRLVLSKNADPGDGYFDVVIVREDQRKLMETYILEMLKNQKAIFPIESVRTKSLSVTWDATDAHADDEILEDHKGGILDITILKSLIEIVTP